jgi:hypothetical protein
MATTNNKNLTMYNAIIAWANKYPTSIALGNYVKGVTGKGVYASGKMFVHYYDMACTFK